MLKLAVCDDSSVFLQEISELLRADRRVGEAAVYEKPEKLLEEIKTGETEIDAIFMDIELNREHNGIQYAQELFRIAPEIPLVYVTGYHSKYIQQMFLSDSNLIGCLTKPLNKEILGQYLDKICEKKKPKNMLAFSVRGKSHIVAADRILYLESNNHRVLIHTDERFYAVYEKLSNIQKRLPSEFIQCHKSFLVNMNRVWYMEGNEFFFQDGSRVPISKIHLENVRKSFFLHLGKAI